MKRTPLKRSQRPIRKKPRTKSEKLRIYGPPGFVEWCKSQPCIACGVVGYSEVAHIKTGGTGRKADWTDTIPLCSARSFVTPSSRGWLMGCHMVLHQTGRESFELRWDIDLEVAAIAIQEQWASHTRLP